MAGRQVVTRGHFRTFCKQQESRTTLHPRNRAVSDVEFLRCPQKAVE